MDEMEATRVDHGPIDEQTFDPGLGCGGARIDRRLGVRELWTLKGDARLVIRSLEEGDWVERRKSNPFAMLDVTWLVSFLGIEPQSKAVTAFRDALRGETGGGR